MWVQYTMFFHFFEDGHFCELLFTSGTMKSFQNGSTLRFYSVCELFACIYELSSPGKKFRDNFPYFSIKT